MATYLIWGKSLRSGDRETNRSPASSPCSVQEPPNPVLVGFLRRPLMAPCNFFRPLDSPCPSSQHAPGCPP